MWKSSCTRSWRLCDQGSKTNPNFHLVVKKKHPRSVTHCCTVVTNTERSGRENTCAWQTCQAITCMLCCDLHLIVHVFGHFTKRSVFKGSEVWRKIIILNKVIVMPQAFCVFFPLQSCRISSPIMGGGGENLKREWSLLTFFPWKGGGILLERGRGAYLRGRFNRGFMVK